MGSAGRFSTAIRITDVNDFLSPSEACVLPLGGGALPDQADSNAVAKVKAAPAGSVLAPILPVQASVAGTTRAKVTVSDCLACSGCVTSAETVLLSTESLDVLRRVMLQERRSMLDKYTVAALSQQAVASIAVHYKMNLATTARKLSTFLRKDIGFDAVVDLSFARHATLLEASAEFIQTFKAGKKLTITSACPGWLTYAEKTQDASILDCISTVRSTQGVLGVISKALLPPMDNRNAWVCSIMPCHDKKLEASRPEFRTRGKVGSDGKEVDCVLTAGELDDLIRERNFNLVDAEESLFNEPCSRSLTSSFGTSVGSGSGGFADFILRAAAKELLGIDLPSDPLPMEKSSKSGDLKTITVSDETGKKQLRFATAYGFRSLQSILRKMRRGECMYHYIELMACPGGCNNGGGQLDAPTDSDSATRTFRQQANDHLELVNRAFSDASPVPDPFSLPSVKRLYDGVIHGLPGSGQAKQMLSISVQSRKSTSTTPASLAW